jgi:hypothetical protein
MTDIDPTELERVIRKIKHCLALSTSANEHEAAAAMRQAQKLMAKYRLTEAEVNLSDVGEARSDLSKAKRDLWDGMLASVVGEVFDCEALTYRGYDRITLKRIERAMFVGVKPAPEIAKYAYETLHRQCSDARKAYIERIKRGEVLAAPGTPNTRGNHFALYWVGEVQDKLRALVPNEDESPEQAESNARALMVIKANNQELITAYINDLTGGKGPADGTNHRKVKVSPVDAHFGTRAGRQAKVNHGVGTNGVPLTAIGQPPVGTQGSFL